MAILRMWVQKSTSEYSKRNCFQRKRSKAIWEKCIYKESLEKVKTVIHKFPAICPENGQKQLRAKSDSIMGCLSSIL